MRLSAVMIARNEEANVDACFASMSPFVDELVLVDTGSTDGTVAKARRFAEGRGEPAKLVVGHFDWRDDFSAARNCARELASGEVHVRLDLDERLVGGEHLREAVAMLADDDDLDAVTLLVKGSVESGLYPRVQRAELVWRGRVWERPERQDGRPLRAKLGPAKLAIEHLREGFHGTRDLDIALRWAEEEPDRYMPHLAAAGEAVQLARWELARECAGRVLRCENADDGARAWALELQAGANAGLGRLSTAERLAHQALDLLPAGDDVGQLPVDTSGVRHRANLLLAFIARQRGYFELAARRAAAAAGAATTLGGRELALKVCFESLTDYGRQYGRDPNPLARELLVPLG